MEYIGGETLTREQINFYKEEGYLLTGKPLFSEEKFELLSQIFEELLIKMGNTKGNELDVPHFTEKRLFDFLLANEVLDIVEDLIGPNIGLWSSHFICKEAFSGNRTPWQEAVFTKKISSWDLSLNPPCRGSAV